MNVIHERPPLGNRKSTCRFLLPVMTLAIARGLLGVAELKAHESYGLPHTAPADAGMDAEQLELIEPLVKEAIAEGEMAGCVVAVGRQGKLVYLRCFGHRQLEPEPQEMTVDTVFDLASLTKPIATATSVMQLLENGRLRLDDPVSKHLPGFEQNEKHSITIQQLLTHQGGLIPDNALADYVDGPKLARERLFALSTVEEPGTKFIYTDVGFIALGWTVEAQSDMPLDEYCRQHIFQPLGMHETGYLPGEELQRRAAATEQRDDQWMVGQVHDPRAYHLGGVAGHAGLFSTAQDLAIYAQMLLNGGSYQGRQILSPRTIKIMTSAYPVSSGLRGLGWDKQTGYSTNRGQLFSPSAFGHGGFTGTAFWVDPELDMFVIFLSNRLHPDGKGSVNHLAGRIGTVAAAAIRHLPDVPADKDTAATNLDVLTGIDVLDSEGFGVLRGKRVGLITNHTGLTRDGRSTIQVLHDSPDVQLRVLFSPEHGLEGKLDVPNIADTADDETGLKVFSLYGESRKPEPAQLQDLDVLVFDIQDIGTRFYTYISTMGLAMQAAAEHELTFVVLDRPNPINGVEVQGPILDEGSQSFVGYHTIPVRHGMTAGELAQMFQAEFHWDLNLHVVAVRGWQRDAYYDQTGLAWVNPSPNMRNLNQALLYPGIGLLETTNLSVGRGTDTPFEILGAPWINERQLALALNDQTLRGVRFVPVRFVPESSKFAGESCGGVQILITNRPAVDPIRIGLAIARQLRIAYPDDWQMSPYKRLLAHQSTWQAIHDGHDVERILADYEAPLTQFLERRERFLLY